MSFLSHSDMTLFQGLRGYLSYFIQHITYGTTNRYCRFNAVNRFLERRFLRLDVTNFKIQLWKAKQSKILEILKVNQEKANLQNLASLNRDINSLQKALNELEDFCEELRTYYQQQELPLKAGSLEKKIRHAIHQVHEQINFEIHRCSPSTAEHLLTLAIKCDIIQTRLL